MPNNETARLAALGSYEVLDTAPEPEFDSLTALAADLFGAPIAVVSLVDETRQWFKSVQGLAVSETPRNVAFCHYAIAADDPVMVVEDATLDPRFADNPLVTGAPGIRFYAGAVLTDPDGHRLGTLCVIDRKPRPRPSEEKLGQLRLLAGIAMDKLRLARADRLARERGRLLDLAAGMAGVGYWRVRLSDLQVSWSPELYRLYGVDPRTFTPSLAAVSAMHDEQFHAHVTGLMSQAIRDRTGFEHRYAIRRPDGAVRSVESKAVCEVNDAGEAAAMFGVVKDVTEHEAAIRRISRSEARFRLLADNMGDVVSRIRPDGFSDYISPGIEQLIGYRPEEMTGRPAQAFVVDEDRPLVDAALAQIAAGAERASAQIRARHKSGAAVWVETNFRRVARPDDASLIETVAVIRDISQRKALEEELRQARDTAETTAEVKSQFLANMSHELRTPLTSILGFTRMLQADDSLGPEAERHVERVAAAGRALLSTINDVLDFSKLEAGLMTLDPRPMSPADLTRGALDLFEPQAQAKGIALAFEAEDLPVAVMADDDRLRQVLLNLIGNALKFTAEGTVTLRVRHDGDLLRAEVSDTGPGIPADRQDRLFKRFSQVDGATTRTHGGTGLGLAICKAVVEAMGGRIGVHSQAGRGATFWIEVPAPPTAALEPAAQAAPAAPDLFRVGARLLIADDNRSNRELVRAILAPYSFEVTEAADGREAAGLAAVQTFDLILMDVRMPVLDGPAATRLIRRGEGPNSAAPILAFTADTEDSEAQLAAAGFDGRVVKPLSPVELLGALLPWLAADADDDGVRAAG